jgi:hypothetical protein
MLIGFGFWMFCYNPKIFDPYCNKTKENNFLSIVAIFLGLWNCLGIMLADVGCLIGGICQM